MAARRRKKAPTRSRSRRSKPAASKRKKAPARKRGKKPARKKARKAAAPSLESLARKMVRATRGDPAKFSFADLYASDAVSREAAGEPATGLAAIQAKGEMWESMQDSRAAKWKPVNVFTRGNTICIEWEADLRMRDGRGVTFREVAVHEVRKGKIVRERYYYDPASLAPPPSA